jgi:hypothetical protein
MPRKATYSKYQQWVDAGRPYWAGVALANHVRGFPTLKKHFNAKESPWNRLKLDVFLRDHFSTLPAEALQPQDVAQAKAATPRPPHTILPPATPDVPAPTAAPTKTVLRGHFGASTIDAGKVGSPGPKPAPPWTESSLALPPFEELPEVLQRARVENVQRRRRAEELHERLAEGIADAYQRQDTISELVMLMDTVMASYDAERDYMLHRVVPHVPDDEATTLRRMDLYTLQRTIANSLSPRVSRLRNQTRLRDGDALVETRLQLAHAETLVALARTILQEKRRAHDMEMAKLEHEQAQRRTAKANTKRKR